jgi:hypothetical protein
MNPTIVGTDRLNEKERLDPELCLGVLKNGPFGAILQ